MKDDRERKTTQAGEGRNIGSFKEMKIQYFPVRFGQNLKKSTYINPRFNKELDTIREENEGLPKSYYWHNKKTTLPTCALEEIPLE